MTPLAYTRRTLKLQRQCKPCPRCGREPEVDLGLLDGPFEAEYVRCSAVFLSSSGPFDDQGCGTHAQGVAAWNHQPETDRLRARIEELEAELARSKWMTDGTLCGEKK